MSSGTEAARWSAPRPTPSNVTTAGYRTTAATSPVSCIENATHERRSGNRCVDNGTDRRASGTCYFHPQVSPPVSIPPALLQRHRLFNRNSSSRWDAFAGHRAQVMGLLADAARARPDRGRICVLGAGNCNDLDLPQLFGQFREIHLCDMDDEALGKAPGRQQVPPDAPLVLHAPLDLSGALPRLPGYARATPNAAQLAELGQACVQDVVGRLPGPFDVVLSACLLSQLMHSCRLALGADNPGLVAIANALVIAHLRTTVALTAPGGVAIVVTDTASSKTYPLVELWGEKEPLALLDELERSDNVLSGTGPTYLRRLLARDAIIKPQLRAPARIVAPWLWDLGDEVTLLAYALVLEHV
jgi:hypothetical protein